MRRLFGDASLPAQEKACSFLKKRTKRLLFLRPRQDPGHGL
jgi:hypothetical protein